MRCRIIRRSSSGFGILAKDSRTGRLVDADSGKQGELSRTISHFADCNFNVKRTARRLKLHTNTVYFRLNRIRELTSIDPRSYSGLSLLLTTLGMLDGQALRWVSPDELEAVELLPADGPIVAALRLPERLSQASTRDYVLGRLRGVSCDGMADAMAASDAGADFLVLRHKLPHAEIKSICEMIAVPVYVPGLVVEEAWELGATGVVQIGDV